MQRMFVIIGAVTGLTAVLAGTFGAHGLPAYLSARGVVPGAQPYFLDIFETAARYHMYHALALLGAAWAIERFDARLAKLAGWLFIIGVAICAGSLYLLVLTQAKGWGAITPIGGVCLLAGWTMLLASACRGGAMRRIQKGSKVVDAYRPVEE